METKVKITNCRITIRGNTAHLRISPLDMILEHGFYFLKATATLRWEIMMRHGIELIIPQFFSQPIG
jgi:hypothetical protein